MREISYPTSCNTLTQHVDYGLPRLALWNDSYVSPVMTMYLLLLTPHYYWPCSLADVAANIPFRCVTDPRFKPFVRGMHLPTCIRLKNLEVRNSASDPAARVPPSPGPSLRSFNTRALVELPTGRIYYLYTLRARETLRILRKNTLTFYP